MTRKLEGSHHAFEDLHRRGRPSFEAWWLLVVAWVHLSTDEPARRTATRTPPRKTPPPWRQPDWVVVKHRYSGFAYTPLQLALQSKGCDTVMLTGVTTDMCVRSTATDALHSDFILYWSPTPNRVP
ncbi:MAG: isochorismatase family protein [Haloechinothrix sp.]